MRRFATPEVFLAWICGLGDDVTSGNSEEHCDLKSLPNRLLRNYTTESPVTIYMRIVCRISKPPFHLKSASPGEISPSICGPQSYDEIKRSSALAKLLPAEPLQRALHEPRKPRYQSAKHAVESFSKLQRKGSPKDVSKAPPPPKPNPLRTTQYEVTQFPKHTMNSSPRRCLKVPHPLDFSISTSGNCDESSCSCKR
jgi:hypothetical protein